MIIDDMVVGSLVSSYGNDSGMETATIGGTKTCDAAACVRT